MAYTINKTDGTLLVELIDGVLDTESTDLSLVGRNFTGFGESVNENFVKLLENFANTNQPVAPLVGQLWYDKSENKLKVFDGEVFQSAAGSFISESFPAGPIPGDTWFSTVGKQFYLYTGTEWQLIGPAYSEDQGISGITVDTIDDQNLNKITILKLIIDNSLIGVISALDFTPNQLPTNIIQGLVTESNPTGRIFKGWNLLDKTGFIYRGTAENAQNLLSVTGTPIPESILVKTNQPNTVNEVFTIANNGGAIIGLAGEGRFLVDDGVTLDSTSNGLDFNVFVNSGGQRTSAIKVKTSTKRIGLFQSNPLYNLDVTGDVRITGNLTVEGDSITTEVETLTVEDKNIELGSVVSPSDLTANEGGITLRGTTDKTINWYQTTEAWTSSEHFDLVSGKRYRINNVDVLSSTTLHSGVVNSNLQNVGTLTELDIDSIRIDEDAQGRASISRTGGLTGMKISVSGDIDVSGDNITNLAEPVSGVNGEYHATPRIYVDREIQNEPIVFSMDTTGWTLGEVNDRLIELLDDLYPPSIFAQGKEARIACFYYAPGQTTDPIDVAAGTTEQTVLVPTDAGGTAEVLTGVNLPNTLTPQFTLQITREARSFVINTLGNWTVLV